MCNYLILFFMIATFYEFYPYGQGIFADDKYGIIEMFIYAKCIFCE